MAGFFEVATDFSGDRGSFIRPKTVHAQIMLRTTSPDKIAISGPGLCFARREGVDSFPDGWDIVSLQLFFFQAMDNNPPKENARPIARTGIHHQWLQPPSINRLLLLAAEGEHRTTDEEQETRGRLRNVAAT